MRLAELVVDDAKRRGIDHMFGIPGSGFPLDVLEAGRIIGVDLVLTAHESSAAIAAAAVKSATFSSNSPIIACYCRMST